MSYCCRRGRLSDRLRAAESVAADQGARRADAEAALAAAREQLASVTERLADAQRGT